MPQEKQFELVTFTPETAATCLDKAYNRNRPISQPWVETLAGEMKKKLWDINGQTVIFGKTGALLNGHHRMWACVLAGVPFTTWVVRGIDEETYDTMDINKVRTGSDMVFSSGIPKYHKQMATAAGLIIRYNSGKIVNKKKMLPREIVAYTDAHPDLETWCEAACKKEMRGHAAPIAAVAYLGGQRHRTKATDFVDSLVTGANLVNGSPILALRNRLMSRGRGGTKAKIGMKDNQYEKFALVIQAWNAFMEDRHIFKMQLFTGDKFPKIRGASL